MEAFTKTSMAIIAQAYAQYDLHLPPCHNPRELIINWVAVWRKALGSGELLSQQQWVGQFACLAMHAMNSSSLTTQERASLFDQIVRLSYHRPFSAEEDSTFNNLMDMWGDEYLPLYVRNPLSLEFPLPSIPITLLSSLPTTLPPPPPNSLPTHPSSVSPLSPKKRGRPRKNPDAPPKEKKAVGRPRGAVDTQKRKPKGTWVGMSKAQIREAKKSEREVFEKLQ